MAMFHPNSASELVVIRITAFTFPIFDFVIEIVMKIAISWSESSGIDVLFDLEYADNLVLLLMKAARFIDRSNDRVGVWYVFLYLLNAKCCCRPRMVQSRTLF